MIINVLTLTNETELIGKVNKLKNLYPFPAGKLSSSRTATFDE